MTLTSASKFLEEGKIGVIPTDTIYGIVGQALNKETVERIYKVRGRNPSKPMIILISSVEELKLFGVGISEELVSFPTSCAARRREQSKFSAENYANRGNDTNSSRNKLRDLQNLVSETLLLTINQFWPGKVSIILPIKDKNALEKFEYLHRGTGALAFRLPDKKELIELISQTGPLVAPSANQEGLPPAKTIEEAKNYFGNKTDFYVDSGVIESAPSRLIKIEDGKMVDLRK